MSWNIVNESYPQVLRGILQQTLEGLPYVAPTRRIYGGGTAIAEDIREVGLVLRRFELHNRDAASANVGIGFRWANRYWAAGQWVDATTTFTDDTADAQDLPLATADFPLETTTASDGFIVHSDRQFSWVSVRVVTASIDAVSVAHAASYSNFAGSGWTDFGTEAEVQYEAAAQRLLADTIFGANEERCFVFSPPVDWGQTQASGLNGVPGGRYALRVRATDAPTTAAVASVMEVGTMVAVESLAAGGTYGPDWNTYRDPYAEALVAFFSLADAGNRIYAEVTTG